MAKAILYGCSNPDCGYRTLPSTMGTPYTACPLCGGAWMIDPPLARNGDPAKRRGGESPVLPIASSPVQFHPLEDLP